MSIGCWYVLFGKYTAIKVSQLFSLKSNIFIYNIGDFAIQTVLIKNIWYLIKVSKGAKIRSRYNQVPNQTQDTNGKVTNSQLDTTIESQEVSPFPVGDHKAQSWYYSVRTAAIRCDLSYKNMVRLHYIWWRDYIQWF